MRILPTHGHQWLTSCPACLNPGKEPQYPYTEGCVGPRADSDVLDKRKIFCPYQDLKPGSSSYTDHATLPPKHNDFRHSVGVTLSVMSVLRIIISGIPKKEEYTVCKAVMEGISPTFKTQENLATMNVTTFSSL